MERNVEELNVGRANLSAVMGSGIGQSILIYASLATLAFDLSTGIKFAVIIGCATLTVAYQLVTLAISRVSGDVIDELNASLADEVLRYCSEKYSVNDNNVALRFFYTSNEDESTMYLNACLVDKDGKDEEGTKVTIMEMWRFQRTPEFMRHPKKFLVAQKDGLVATTREAVDEFFSRFRDYFNKGKPK